MFTARYGLIPYLEQIAFRLLKVKEQILLIYIYIYIYIAHLLEKYSKYLYMYSLVQHVSTF